MPGLGSSRTNSAPRTTLVAPRRDNRKDPGGQNLSLEHIKNPVLIQPCGVDKTKFADIRIHIDLRNYSYLRS